MDFFVLHLCVCVCVWSDHIGVRHTTEAKKKKKRYQMKLQKEMKYHTKHR